MNVLEIKALFKYLTPEERAEITQIISDDIQKQPWRPLPGPQTMAFNSKATIIGFGGSAGGGKSEVAIGKALMQHQKTLILRREATQLTGIIDRFRDLIGSKDGYNGAERIWRLPGKQIEFGSTPNPDDWNKFQGRPHDFLVFDEAAHFLESQVRALLGWLRTADPNQHCQALLTTNPPTNAEGRWIIPFFAPWLERNHPNPAKPGELRYFASLDGKEIEVSPEPFMHNGDLIVPQSRTFIPSRIVDNPYLIETGYMAQLQSLPEPLRSQMLNGDFQAGMEDDPWQVIPTAWVEAAMQRWEAKSPKPRMDSLGIDVARGGKDRTVISRRHGNWYDELLVYPGTQTPDGPTVAGLVVAATRDRAPQHIDVIGVGASPYDFLRQGRQQVSPINVAVGSNATDKSGALGFSNLRSELWWKLREELDPANDTGIALPNDKLLLADLCAPMWRLQGKTIYVESREEIVKRIGRSPDYASAVILARIDTPRMSDLEGMHTGRRPAYDPYNSILGNR